MEIKILKPCIIKEQIANSDDLAIVAYRRGEICAGYKSEYDAIRKINAIAEAGGKAILIKNT